MTPPGVIVDFFNGFTTDPSGNILSWNIYVKLPTPNGDSFISTFSSSTSFFGIDDGCFTGASFCDSSGRSAMVPGVMTLVPEPATVLLLCAVAGMLAARRR
ncbi:MAG: PEP-CTERM sorting domain-containing protein [Deltaproteobacteria bacterium]|nr:PEP-CTERM sorting domain-containing protein [Deltaproteobacteria bacterium]